MRASNRSACKKASNLLLTNRYSTITEVANMCGYSSQTSFIRAFKERFHMTPKDWRNGGYKEYSLQILRQSKKAMSSHATFDGLKPTIVKQPPPYVIYRKNDYLSEDGSFDISFYISIRF